MEKIVLSLVAVAILFINITGQANATLVGYWDFEDSVADQSGNGIDGTIFGDAAFVSDTPAAIVGTKSMQFDGDGDYVDLGNPALLDFGTGNWTVAGWIKTTQSERGTLFSNGGDDSGGIRYVLTQGESNANKLTLTTDDNSSKRQAKGGTVINDGVWHHIVGVRDGLETRVYVDGILDGSIDVPDGYDLSGTSQVNAYIGIGFSFGNSEFVKGLDGLVDDVAVWDEALSDATILGIAQGTIAIPEPSTAILALLGALGLFGFGYNRRRAA